MAAETGGRGRVLRLRVWTSGNPVPLGFDPREQKGLGLQLCRELVGRQLRGSLRVWADRGGTASEIMVDDHSLEREGGAA
jgi:two-component sensor histidine kinase